jgi:hypothetical protein
VPVPDSVAELIDTARSEVSVLLNRVRAGVAEHVAQLSGHTAGWVDDAGDAVGVVTAAATTTVARLSHRAAEAVSESTGQACGQLARTASRWSEDLGDQVVRARRAGHDLARTRLPDG